jgi:AraC family transcriptional regulator
MSVEPLGRDATNGMLLREMRQDWRRTPEDLQQADCRTRLMTLSVGLVEDLASGGVPRQNGAAGFSPQFQMCLPYRGLLVWHVGGDAVVGDANQVLFVTGGESFRISQPLAEGYREIIITPELSVLSEIAGAHAGHLPAHPLFRRRSRRASQRLQGLRTRFLYWAKSGSLVDDLAAEELVLALLRAGLDGDTPGNPPGGSTRKLMRRTKEYLEAELANPIRLADVGRAVGASPAYLTHVFRRVEGTSLHRYLMQLRLARALVELPHADDLTTLALDVGFSSHSHFTAAFRRAFGATPSEFRRTSRRRD